MKIIELLLQCFTIYKVFSRFYLKLVNQSLLMILCFIIVKNQFMVMHPSNYDFALWLSKGPMQYWLLCNILINHVVLYKMLSFLHNKYKYLANPPHHTSFSGECIDMQQDGFGFYAGLVSEKPIVLLFFSVSMFALPQLWNRHSNV